MSTEAQIGPIYSLDTSQFIYCGVGQAETEIHHRIPRNDSRRARNQKRTIGGTILTDKLSEDTLPLADTNIGVRPAPSSRHDFRPST